MLHAREPGAEVEQVVLRFRAELPAAVVAEAWRATVAETAVLRCRVTERGPVSAAGEGSAGVATGFSADWLAEDRVRPFGTGPPWRTCHFADSRRWVWTFAHALLDGRSITAVLRAFLRRLAGRPAPPLALAAWQPADEATRGRAMEHFRQVLRDAEVAEPDFGGEGRVRQARSLGKAEELESAAAVAGVTAATLVTWAWGQVLLRAAGVEKALIGQVRSGRRREGEAGFTLNTLPLAVGRAGAGPAADEWSALRREMLALRDFEGIAPQDLPEEVFPENGPWSSVLMIERGELLHELGDDGELLESAELHEQPSGGLLASAWLRPELKLEVETDGGGAAAGALLRHWAAVIESILADPGGMAVTLADLPAADREAISRWEDGGPALAGPGHLTDAWRQAVASHEARQAVWTTAGSWTYRELDEEVERWAAALADAGVSAGRTVAVSASDRRGWPLALLALARRGAVYLPLDARAPVPRRQAIVRAADPAVILTTSGAAEDFGLPRVTPDEAGSAGASSAKPAARSGLAADVLAVLFTSGSTGEPKGVLLGHAGVLNEARWTAGVLGLGPGDRLLQFSSPGFDTSLEEMLSCLLSGATLVPRPDDLTDDFARFQDFVAMAGITVLDLPTAYWSAWSAWLAENKLRVPGCVRATIIGGERASARSVADWQAAGGGLLWNGYGPTETSIIATAIEITAAPGDPPIGRPLPGCRVRVADAAGRTVPAGAAGEIRIGGPCVGPGYLDGDLRQAFVEEGDGRWYRTGDLGRWDAWGRLHFIGRRDDQVKIRGHRIEPEEIIRALEAFPGVAAAHAGPWGEGPLLAAWVRWSGPVPADWQKRLRQCLARELPPAFVPVLWAAVDEFPLTERGKLDRRALPAPMPWKSSNHQAPASPTEQELAVWWDELLGCGPPGRQDDFFELGGDSLAALRLFSRICGELGTTLPMTTLIAAPTLAGLAAAIDAGSADAGVVPLVRLREGSGPPLVCLHGGDGGVFFYRQLAESLQPDIPLLTLESPALGAAEPPAGMEVEALARRYLVALRRHQPQGPYRLAGYSFGGVMAYEMAARLRAAGEEVAFLGLFDTENPAAAWRRYSLAERAAVFWRASAGRALPLRLARLLGRIAAGIEVHFRVKLEQAAVRHFRRSSPYGRLRALQVREQHATAMDAYRPAPLDLPLHLFRTAAVDDKFAVAPDYGWSALTPRLRIADVPGEHLTMFSPRNAPALARELEKCLALTNASGG
jgi:amino acid adenylation domain-containing protein